MFGRKIEKEGQVVDLSLLPPWRAHLKLHTTPAYYVAHMYRQTKEFAINPDNPSNRGWDDQGNVIWSNICCPDDLSELLIDMKDIDVAETDFNNDEFLWDDFEEDLWISKTTSKLFPI